MHIIGHGRYGRVAYPVRSSRIAAQQALVCESEDVIAFSSGVGLSLDIPLPEVFTSGAPFWTRTGDDIVLEEGLYGIESRIVLSSGQNTITLNTLFNGGLNVIPATADAITNGFLSDMSVYGLIYNPGTITALAMKATGAGGNVTLRQVCIVKYA